MININPNITTIGEHTIGLDAIETIIAIHESKKVSEVIITPTGKLFPKEVGAPDDILRYDYKGKEILHIRSQNELCDEVLNLAIDFIPENDEFEFIDTINIIKLTSGSCIPLDTGEETETGKVLFMLNDEYLGGNTLIDSNTITCITDTMIAFNNSSERWHGVAPVLSGEKWVLELIFKIDNNPEEEEEEKEQTPTKVYSKGTVKL